MVRRGPRVLLLIDVHWQDNKNFVSSCVFFSSHYYPAPARSVQAWAWHTRCRASVSVKRHICRYTFVMFCKKARPTTYSTLMGILFYFYISVIDICFDWLIFVLQCNCYIYDTKKEENLMVVDEIKDMYSKVNTTSDWWWKCFLLQRIWKTFIFSWI